MGARRRAPELVGAVPCWSFWIDRGGTFTDCVARDPLGNLHVGKVLSSDQAPLAVIRKILGLTEQDTIPPCRVRLGSTIATNALLERKGAPTALVITRGFGDLMEIGTQARPTLFEIDIHKTEVLQSAVLELDARHDPAGVVTSEPDPVATRQSLAKLAEQGLTSAAITFIHSYHDGGLETRVAEWAGEMGFDYVATSHELAPELGFLNRATTTVLDAYLTPCLRGHLTELERDLADCEVRIMQSDGTLTDSSNIRGPNAILSGPAGGVVAYARLAQSIGVKRAIGFDMGGTSTDVSRYDAEFERTYEATVAGVRIASPMLRIHTVAAGGGSICRFDGSRFMVGPESAGAVPGPLCYGRSAPQAKIQELTVTDVNLLLGRFHPARFPLPVDADRPTLALEQLRQAAAAAGSTLTSEQLAEGLFEIANVNMAEAIRFVSVARGHDVRDHALFVFGGAGGQHACAIARRLGIREVLFHSLSGVLSALGMGLADEGWQASVHGGDRSLSPEALSELEASFVELERRGREHFAGISEQRFRSVRSLQLRYAGTQSSVVLPCASACELETRFHAEHTREFGYARPGSPIQIVQLRLECSAKSSSSLLPSPKEDGSTGAAPFPPTRIFCDGQWQETVPVLWRERLRTGQRFSGPLLILESTSTIVIDPGFDVEVLEAGFLRAINMSSATGAAAAVRGAGKSDPRQPTTSPDPVALEVMGHSFMSIAEQMGEALRRTAMSTNIRERLDYSCALFDRWGHLVANAPHIPVHLGAMGESVRAVIATHPNMQPGDAFITNDPAAGGSHLPDLTLVTPVHDAKGQICFFTASRGHHADVGGLTPGSMPAFSTNLDEEGIVFRAQPVVLRHELQERELLDTLTSGPYPARDPAMNLADIRAQLAANQLGARLLLDLVDQYSLAYVSAYMGHVQDEASYKVVQLIRKLGTAPRHFSDSLDDGSCIHVCLCCRGDTLTIDFTGTAPELDNNLNAPRAVSSAAVLYCIRCMIRDTLPLNEGCLRPVRIVIPPGSLLAPGAQRAVAGGNVETSQRVVDVLLGAFGLAAASQGTMNNLSFGNETFGYYETLGGGAGAGPGFHGASCVHTHMTNTRITDPEWLESHFPVRLLEFSRRRHSGGEGRFSGGDGIRRHFEFLQPVTVSLLTERRVRRPFGLEGGHPGQPGRNLLNGQDLPGRTTVPVAAGDRLLIESPGGGGYGTRGDSA